MAAGVLRCLFLAVPWVGLLSVIVAFLGHAFLGHAFLGHFLVDNVKEKGFRALQ